MGNDNSDLTLAEINSLLDEALARMNDPEGDAERARLKAESEQAIECLHVAVADLVGAKPRARRGDRAAAVPGR